MADINNQVFTVSGSPTINYKVAYSIGVKFDIELKGGN